MKNRNGKPFVETTKNCRHRPNKFMKRYHCIPILGLRVLWFLPVSICSIIECMSSLAESIKSNALIAKKLKRKEPIQSVDVDKGNM